MSHATVVRPSPTSDDWRLQVPEPRRRTLRLWLWSVAAMTFVVLVVGGITRLTQSGLSIVDWQPIMGVVPPLGEAQWQEAFDRYREFPEYQRLRQGMSLDEFKFIFFWEYLHRLVARLIGLVFLVPFIFFWVRGWFSRPLFTRSLALFALGGMQGVLGWLMVQSGLVDRPAVSHYRLAAHLSLAFVIFGYAVWLARDLALPAVRRTVPAATRALMLRGLAVVGVLLCVQIVYGAFVAGLKAGFTYNTFPLMAGKLVPPGFLSYDPPLLGMLQHPGAVQWIHRVLGTLLGVAALVFFLRVRRAPVDRAARRLNAAFAGLIGAQYLLGVATLLLFVPVALGVAHQALAMVVFGVWVIWLHRVHNSEAAG
jgi:heme a synthase